MENGVQRTHERLEEQLLRYIETEYLGKNDALRKMCHDELLREGILFRQPYIESSPSYQPGVAWSEFRDIPNDIQKIMQKLSELKLGVYPRPWYHQQESLSRFYQRNDLFVTTGTGSGKTECFLWPMISRLIHEAISTPDAWNIRGVRVILMYPMNALVSDQIGRLRRTLGSTQFYDYFNQTTSGQRIPQFGMYTGRTPYPGVHAPSKDKEVSKSLRKHLLDPDESIRTRLKEMGKYPGKYDLENFIQHLDRGKHFTHDRDVELITRQEMQQKTPDILITNYSMLEYMLVRNIENSLWENTRRWLDCDPKNRLLFVIDESHMYRGAAGGEVALLIRRFLHRLKIERDRIQFILTSASIPADENTDQKIKQFAADLTAGQPSRFALIRGKEVVPDTTVGNEWIPISSDSRSETKLSQNSEISHTTQNHEDICQQIRQFGQWINARNISDPPCSEETLHERLYDYLNQLLPMRRLMRQCRGNATPLSELAKVVFPDLSDKSAAADGVNTLLAIAPLAKKNGQMLFSTRMHMMFRGLNGLYACSNPFCDQKCSSDNTWSLGKVYVNIFRDRCKCGGKIYILMNDRTCGAVFLKGYMKDGEDFVWNRPGIFRDEDLREVHFYVLNAEEPYSKNRDWNLGWLECNTGHLYYDDTHAGQSGFIQVIWAKKPQTIDGRSNLCTFTVCPQCGKKPVHITDFTTRGNEPFFNLVSEQFRMQSPSISDPEQLKLTPNAGRKVLLFSDSRQSAARLALNLSDASDENAMSQVLTLAAIKLQKWAEENGRDPELYRLYPMFLKLAIEKDLYFFYGDDDQEFRKSMERIRHIDMNTIMTRYNQDKFTAPQLYYYHLLKLLCNSFRTLTDRGLCWIAPTDDVIQSYYQSNPDDSLSKEEFSILFAVICDHMSTTHYALGHKIKNAIRRKLNPYPSFGVKSGNIIHESLKRHFEKLAFTDNQIEKVCEVIEEEAMTEMTEPDSSNSGEIFLNLHNIILHSEPSHDWYKCTRCGRIFPFILRDHCALCGGENPFKMTEQDFDQVAFWRDPILKAINDKTPILRINVEEHTAQLSYKDSRQQVWSVTEDYEMRFQNMYVENQRPVDVLSCTTTMEVGIDIGSLTAVGLRNVPPKRENYQQRAGRAGRRGTAVSTIVTFTGDGPHDSWYFSHPENMITGSPNLPWIDVENTRLIRRHIAVILLKRYLEQYPEENQSTEDSIPCDLSTMGVISFSECNLNTIDARLRAMDFTAEEIYRLIPEKRGKMFQNLRGEAIDEIRKALQKVQEFPDNYRELDYSSQRKKRVDPREKSLLDVMLEEGVFPSYSFPRNIVGFHIEDENGTIVKKPDRSLDIAISEYAPGRHMVVDKKTYVSGGIYSTASRFRSGYYEKPAAPFFEHSDYYKRIYLCENSACKWLGLERPQDGCCPFCGKSLPPSEHYMLTPWGFAPRNGTAEPSANGDDDMTFAEEPCYSTTPKECDMQKIATFRWMRYARRENQPLIILNKGIQSKGFMVCDKCGAATICTDSHSPPKDKLKRPYRIQGSNCSHELRNVFLGCKFLTDMLVCEIDLSSKEINATPENRWLDTALLTLSEATVLAAGRLLDVDFNDIQCGYRLRRSQENDQIYGDIFLYDSLSSGAGYCAALAHQVEELFQEIRKTLDCNCEDACHQCLKHYRNQRQHWRLNRYAAIELLDWCCDGRLAPPIPTDKQWNMLNSLFSLLEQERIILKRDSGKIVACHNDEQKIVYIHPDMWSVHNLCIPKDAIRLPATEIRTALPQTYSTIYEHFNPNTAFH